MKLLIASILSAAAIAVAADAPKVEPRKLAPISNEVYLELQALDMQRNAVMRIADDLVKRAKELLEIATARETERINELVAKACEAAKIPAGECGGIDLKAKVVKRAEKAKQ